MSPRNLRIIIRRVDNLGDIVIAIPVIRALRANHPQAEFTLMVNECHRMLCTGLAEHFIEPVPLDKFSAIARRYDRAYNIDYFAPEKPRRKSRGRTIVHHINALGSSRRQHITRHLLEGLTRHKLPIPRSTEPRITIPKEVRASADDWIRKSGIDHKTTICIGIHIGSRDPAKCWPIERYEQLCLWLWRSFRAHLFFFGSSQEEELIRILDKQLPGACSTTIIGQPLDTVAALLSRMDFVIGNDSGISHLAAAVKTPTVSIFGPTSPVVWRPAGKRSIVVFESAITSDNRRNTIGSNSESRLLRISVDQVIQGVFLCIQRHIPRDRFLLLDRLTVSKSIRFERSAEGVIVRSSTRGPSCLVREGWANVKRILDSVRKYNSYERTLRQHPDAKPLLDLFILHRIIHQRNSVQEQR